MVIETFDGSLHKVNILDNHENAFEEAKDGSLVFVMINNGRSFNLACKDAELIDYDLTDRLVKAITVETSRSQQVYHRLISRPIPVNLRPYSVTHYRPFISASNRLDFNSSAFIMRYLNRTIYRSPEMVEGEDEAF